MYAMDALKTAAKTAGVTLLHISIEIGKARTYVNTTISKGTIPRCDNMARMLDVCGYGLFAMPYKDAPMDALQITYDGQKEHGAR